ncbi:MAG: hypothetical protein GF307_15250 [candidate division Zixibacteria bacterium]|nr:hypothetical protein [candidate division Zixibacteria bacterium]
MMLLRLSVIILILNSIVFAQEEMTLEEAIRIGLENNYSIRIARNNSDIASNNKGLGTANFLPTLDAAAGYQKSSTEEETNSPFSFGDTETDNLTASVSLNWTIFDGFRMFAERGRYSKLAKLGEYQAREIIENSVLAISQAYFNLVQQEQLLEATIDSRDVSETRLEKEKIRNELGGASSTDLLNATVSFNNDQALYLNQQLNVITATEELNLLLGREPDSQVKVRKEIKIPPFTLDMEEIDKIAIERNSSLKVAEFDVKAAEHTVGSARAAFFPRLNLNAGYSYTDRTISRETGSGDITTESKGASIGLNLTFNIFNGTRDMISYKNAVLTARNKKLALENAENNLKGEVRRLYETYKKRMELLRLEETNVRAANQNLKLQQDRYAIGATSSIEFRDAQVNLLRTQTSLISARFQARIALLRIEKLIGQLPVE